MPILLGAGPMMDKPYSQACENNKAPILAVLREALGECRRVLEIGSGTGQHAVHFAAALAHLEWQPSDCAPNLPGLRAWVDDADLANLRAPLALNVQDRPWPLISFDAVFSANTAHIMHWPAVERMFAGVGEYLDTPGVMALYGPFRYAGRHTAASNARFDAWLRARDPDMGVRDFEALAALAREAGLELLADHAMPANNRTLVWRRASRCSS